MLHIGIDTGVNTGIAVWDSEIGQFLSIETVTASKAMFAVMELHKDSTGIMVYIEDARKRNWFGASGPEKWQGAGSIKRDAKLWEDFCKENKISYELIPPRNNMTKISAELFAKVTGWIKKTSEHGRDAAMMVFNR